MTVDQNAIYVPGLIDSRRVGPFQYSVVALCGLVLFLDGFDTQAISYIAPLIARDWHLPPTVVGTIFSATLVGLMVGYLFVSPLSDWFGHKRVMVTTTFLFGVFTLVTAFVGSAEELIALRFLTGLGLGAAAPSAIALTGEYSPQRLRATFVLLIYCGFSLGFVAAGLLAGWLLPVYGWPSLLWAGAVAPIALSLALVRLLPESLHFLVRRADSGRVLGLLRRMYPGEPRPADVATFRVDAAGPRRAAIASLFRNNRALGTLLLWVVFVINLAEFYAMQSWLPSILTRLQQPMDVVVAATSLSTTGGIVAAFVIGPAMDRIGPYRALATVYFAGALLVALVGAAFTSALWVLLTATFCAGFCVSGGQKSVIALAAVFYPAPIRSTGVGWALGVGRIGGIGGPFLVGVLLGLKWAPAMVFYAMGVPMLCAGLAVTAMGRIYGRAPEAPHDSIRAGEAFVQKAE